MKFFLRVFGLLILLIAAYVAIFNLWPSKDARNRMALDKLTDVHHTTPQERSAHPVQNQAPKINLKEQVAAAAKDARVEVLSFQDTGGQAYVTIQWKSGNFAQGGDFLDYLINHGVIRDFEEGESTTYTNNSGQYVHTMKLTLIPY
ncbi:hypothetical protein KQI84_18770 [bacterium]|nr:hypothetical protein [bacterium]